MKFANHLLLAGLLAFSPVACTRNNSPDEQVSANADRTGQPNPPAPPAAQPSKPNQPTPAAPAEPKRPADRTQTVTVPEGTAITATLADAIGTDTSNEGDTFAAHLSSPIAVDGKVVANKGALVKGHVKKVDEPGRVKGKARLELVLDEIQLGGTSHNIPTEPFIAVANDTHTRDAAEIAGGAGVGVAIGAIAGGKKGAALGAIIGGGTGTTAVLLTKGKQLKLEPETKVNFVLSRDVNLPVIRARG
jgi:hypothetical protein